MRQLLRESMPELDMFSCFLREMYDTDVLLFLLHARAVIEKHRTFEVSTIVCLSFHPMSKEHVHALKGLACRKRVAAASSPAATCK